MANKEVYIVLANLMDKKGELNKESKLRIDKLIEVLDTKTQAKVFFCGWAYRKDCSLTIARAQKKYFQSISSSKHETYLIEDSRDTVGDAVFSRRFIESHLAIKNVNVFTSDYHVDRTKFIFQFVYGNFYNIKVIGATTDLQKDLCDAEFDSLNSFKKTFTGVKKGDLTKIIYTMKAKHPFYNGEVY